MMTINILLEEVDKKDKSEQPPKKDQKLSEAKDRCLLGNC